MPISYRDTVIGRIGIHERNGKITHLFFENKRAPSVMEPGESQLLDRAFSQLGEYLAGKRQIFDLPLAPSGTDWQLKCWNALCEIPYGETVSYGEIAKRVGNPRACRAVGLANNRNPIAVFIPCHRVVGSNGALTGFGGGLNVKQMLLELEKRAASAGHRQYQSP